MVPQAKLYAHETCSEILCRTRACILQDLWPGPRNQMKNFKHNSLVKMSTLSHSGPPGLTVGTSGAVRSAMVLNSLPVQMFVFFGLYVVAAFSYVVLCRRGARSLASTWERVQNFSIRKASVFHEPDRPVTKIFTPCPYPSKLELISDSGPRAWPHIPRLSPLCIPPGQSICLPASAMGAFLG